MIPTWLQIIALISLLVGLGCAVAIAIDEFSRPQKMWIMNVVWPVFALFGSLPALCAYFAYGRTGAGRMDHHSETPFAVMVGKAAAHCGSGCTLGDIVAEWLAFLAPGVAVWFGWQTLFADKIFAVWIIDFIFAFLIGIVFQYFTIAPMRGLGLVDGLIAAMKADALSLTAWQVGMYGFMAVAHFWIFGAVLKAPLEPTDPSFWFMMQIAMWFGFLTSYPVNWWLVRTGIKERM